MFLGANGGSHVRAMLCSPDRWHRPLARPVRHFGDGHGLPGPDSRTFAANTEVRAPVFSASTDALRRCATSQSSKRFLPAGLNPDFRADQWFLDLARWTIAASPKVRATI